MNKKRNELVDGLLAGAPPRNWWDDFGRDDWEWVAKAILQDQVGHKIEALREVFRGRVAEDLKKFFDKEGESFELEDFTIQEGIWGPFFEGLSAVADFERKVRRRAQAKRQHMP